jgi:hypothetical protein
MRANVTPIPHISSRRAHGRSTGTVCVIFSFSYRPPYALQGFLYDFPFTFGLKLRGFVRSLQV